MVELPPIRPGMGMPCRRALLCGLLGLAAAGGAAVPAGASPVQLDGDPALEELVRVPVRLPYFPRLPAGVSWAVADRVDGRRVVRPIGPPGERLRRPRLGDRNGDGRVDLFLQAQAGNSLFFGEVAEWDGRRVRRLWRFDGRAVIALIGRDLGVNAPTFTRFPDEDRDGVRDIEIGAAAGACRACPPEVEYRLRYRWSPERHRWVFARLEREVARG